MIGWRPPPGNSEHLGDANRGQREADAGRRAEIFREKRPALSLGQDNGLLKAKCLG